MAVITISRQSGSGGDEVAQRVAARLGYRLVERELINQAAVRAGAPEVALAMIDELNLFGLSLTAEDCQAYLAAVKTVMEELAAAGNVVILGRAGQVILAGEPQSLHVLILAPAELCAGRLAQQSNIPLRAALARIRAADRHRRIYLKRFYDLQWEDPSQYDLVINMARITPETAADLICRAVEHRFPNPTANSPR
jgi:CMP/dCMP kinase